MVDRESCDICIIGAGAAGLSVAAAAGLLGARAILVERGAMGGDCLNVGCVPSKALLAAAKMAVIGSRASAFGIRYAPPDVDFGAVMAHVRGVIAGIAPQDSAERYRAMGVDVIAGTAQFSGRNLLAVTPNAHGAAVRHIAARRYVIATGSRPAVPPIPGLAGLPYLTNENLFDLTRRPAHLLVLGGGPIGVEMAQAFRRLGSRVTLLEANRILPREDPELTGFVRSALRRDGVVLREGIAITRIDPDPGSDAVGFRVRIQGDPVDLVGSHLLVAAGRRPNLEELDLAAAGVEADPGGIRVDRRLRTSNRRIFAIGDIAGGPQFTHLASHHAGIVVRNALFRIPARAQVDGIPRVTFTEPELAWVGCSEAEARERAGTIRILRWPFAENDRARAERDEGGAIKVIVDRRGRILGAGIAGPHAGELIQPWILALGKRMGIGTIAAGMPPYPTLGEVGKRAASTYYQGKLFSPLAKKLVRVLFRLP